MYDGKALNPAPVPSVDLRHMGPMRLSRFWSAVHDALLYADPRAATGGRVSACVRACRDVFRQGCEREQDGAALPCGEGYKVGGPTGCLSWEQQRVLEGGGKR